MIERPHIARWREFAPWQDVAQVEQDLIISRTIIHLFNDDFLCQNLVFRGGTALHKLYLSPAPRYSEDIDLVQILPGPIKPILQKINEVIDFLTKNGKQNKKNTITPSIIIFFLKLLRKSGCD